MLVSGINVDWFHNLLERKKDVHVHTGGRISNSDWMCSDHSILIWVNNGGLWEIYLAAWGKIEGQICQENDIAKMHVMYQNYISVFTVHLKMAQIFTDLSTGSKQIAYTIKTKM